MAFYAGTYKGNALLLNLEWKDPQRIIDKPWTEDIAKFQKEAEGINKAGLTKCIVSLLTSERQHDFLLCLPMVIPDTTDLEIILSFANIKPQDSPMDLNRLFSIVGGLGAVTNLEIQCGYGKAPLQAVPAQLLLPMRSTLRDLTLVSVCVNLELLTTFLSGFGAKWNSLCLMHLYHSELWSSKQTDNSKTNKQVNRAWDAYIDEWNKDTINFMWSHPTCSKLERSRLLGDNQRTSVGGPIKLTVPPLVRLLASNAKNYHSLVSPLMGNSDKETEKIFWQRWYKAGSGPFDGIPTGVDYLYCDDEVKGNIDLIRTNFALGLMTTNLDVFLQTICPGHLKSLPSSSAATESSKRTNNGCIGTQPTTLLTSLEELQQVSLSVGK